MKPLGIMTTWNRYERTKEALAGLEPDLDGFEEFVICDNGSEKKTRRLVKEWAKSHGGQVETYLRPYNIGTPRALNWAIYQHRIGGQSVIKIDNDVKFLNSGWLEGVVNLADTLRRSGRRVGIITALYDRMFTNKRVLKEERVMGERLVSYYPSTGCATFFTGEFWDKVGYFDVLRRDHLYGFEDTIVAYKARLRHFEILAWGGWKVKHEAGSAMKNRDRHIAKMRPLYEERMKRIRKSGVVLTGCDGALMDTERIQEIKECMS